MNSKRLVSTIKHCNDRVAYTLQYKHFGIADGSAYLIYNDLKYIESENQLDKVAYTWVLDIYNSIDNLVSFKKLFDKKAMEV